MSEYSKNKYYTDEDVEKAKQLADEFYQVKYFPKLFRNGNKKLEKNVLIWDIPAIVTCKGQCKGCYALKAERIYKNTRVMRAFHYEIIKQALQDVRKRDYLVRYMMTELENHQLIYKLPVVRLHASGDMFSDEYLKFWLDIIKANPGIKFYTYTKMYSNDEIDKINRQYQNFNIVKSIIDDKFINFGDVEYLEKVTRELTKRNLQYYVCDYGTKDSKATCMGNCTACLNCSNVLFHKH